MYNFKVSTRKNKKYDVFKNDKYLTSFGNKNYQQFKDTNKIDFYGSGCDNPIDFKVDGLKNYRFSIVIENSIESDYFTEKLLDCFLTGTIPIYWGTKNIENYFDINGVIFINDESDLSSIINNLTDELYNSKL